MELKIEFNDLIKEVEIELKQSLRDDVKVKLIAKMKEIEAAKKVIRLLVEELNVMKTKAEKGIL